MIAAAALAVVFSGSAAAQGQGVAAAKQRYVQGSWVNLRESAQSSARIVAQVPANAVLQQLTERDGWCAVLYAGDARLGPPLAEPLQAHVACNLLADKPSPWPRRAKMLPAPSGSPHRPTACAPTATPCRVRQPCNCPRWPRATRTRCQCSTPPGLSGTPPKAHARWRGAAARAGNRPGPPGQPAGRPEAGHPCRGPHPCRGTLAAPPTLPAIAPSYFRSHTSVALLHETDADGLAAVAGTRISVVPTGVPVGRFNRHSGPEIEYITGFWDVGTADQAFAPALTIYAITHQGLVGAHTVRQRYWDISNEDHYCGGHYPGRGSTTLVKKPSPYAAMPSCPTAPRF